MGRSGGGGGHSSGGSHSHSSRSHGSSHSHSSRSSGRSYSSSSSSSYSSSRSYGGGHHYHHHHYSNGGSSPSISAIFTWIAICFILLAVYIIISPSSSSIPASTTQRERVNTKNAYINDCVIDEIGWIDNETKVASKLKEFYKLTGCQPYIILREYDSTMDTMSKREAWSQSYYDTHFQEKC